MTTRSRTHSPGCTEGVQIDRFRRVQGISEDGSSKTAFLLEAIGNAGKVMLVERPAPLLMQADEAVEEVVIAQQPSVDSE